MCGLEGNGSYGWPPEGDGCVGGGEVRAGIRVRTAGQAATLPQMVRPGTPLVGLVRDRDGREVGGESILVEATAHYGGGPQMAHVTVGVPTVMPCDADGPDSDAPLEQAWYEYEFDDRRPLAAVMRMVARKTCSANGCMAYGCQACTARSPHPDDEWEIDF